jgi:hypothetical protein
MATSSNNLNELSALRNATELLVEMAHRLNIDISDLTTEIGAVLSLGPSSSSTSSSPKRASTKLEHNMLERNLVSPKSSVTGTPKGVTTPTDKLAPSQRLSVVLAALPTPPATPPSLTNVIGLDNLTVPTAKSASKSGYRSASLSRMRPQQLVPEQAIAADGHVKIEGSAEEALPAPAADRSNLSPAAANPSASTSGSISPKRLAPAIAPPALPPPFTSTVSSRSLTTTADLFPTPPPPTRHMSFGRSPSSDTRGRFATMQHERTPPSLAAAMGAANSRPLIARVATSALPPTGSGGASALRTGLQTGAPPFKQGASSSAAVPPPAAARPVVPLQKDSKAGPQRVIAASGSSARLPLSRSSSLSIAAGATAATAAVGGHSASTGKRPGSGGGGAASTVPGQGTSGVGGGAGTGSLKQPPRRV